MKHIFRNTVGRAWVRSNPGLGMQLHEPKKGPHLPPHGASLALLLAHSFSAKRHDTCLLEWELKLSQVENYTKRGVQMKMEISLSGVPLRAPHLTPPACALTSPLLQPYRWEPWPHFIMALTSLRYLTEDPQLERRRSWKWESLVCDSEAGWWTANPRSSPYRFQMASHCKKTPTMFLKGKHLFVFLSPEHRARVYSWLTPLSFLLRPPCPTYPTKQRKLVPQCGCQQRSHWL